jgi:hypothetical protein
MPNVLLRGLDRHANEVVLGQLSYAASRFSLTPKNNVLLRNVLRTQVVIGRRTYMSKKNPNAWMKNLHYALTSAYLRAEQLTVSNAGFDPSEKRDGTGKWSKEGSKPSHDIRKLKSEAGYVYHATNLERLHDIAAQGSLRTHRASFGTDQREWPDGSTEKRSYWSEKADVIWQFAPEDGKPVAIRAKRNQHFSNESTGDVYRTKSIKTKYLEYYGSDGQWHPVESLKATK